MTIDTKEIAIYKSKTDKAKESFKQLTVNSKPTFEQAQAFRKSLSILLKGIKEKRDKVVKPLNEGLKEARAIFDPIMNELKEVDKETKLRMETYLLEERKKEEEKKKEIAEKVESGEMSFDKAGAKIEKVENRIEAKTRKIQEVVVEDETKIPQEYYDLNMVRVRKDALSGKKIDGVKVVEKEIVVN